MLQVTIMSRTVDLNPLAVLVSVLVGVELFGLLGALLAIPVGRRDPGDRPRHLGRAPGPAQGRADVGADEVPDQPQQSTDEPPSA